MSSQTLQRCEAELKLGFSHGGVEQSCQVRCVEGEVPSYLKGTYYFNGPAKFQLSPTGVHYKNWLDGDGMICALRFVDGGEIDFQSRFVQSRKLLRETERGERSFRTFGTKFVGDRLRRGIGTESPFNVSVSQFRGRLLAYGEQSLPMELDPTTLETITPGQTFDFDGALNDASPFSAHPKIDSRTGELLNFGIFFAPRQPLLVYYRFDAQGQLARRARIPIEHPCSLHDFAVSEHFAVFYLSPYILDVPSMTDQGLSTLEALSWQPDLGSQLLILHRETGEVAAKIKVPSRYSLHTISAFERDGSLFVDLIELERPIYDQYCLTDMFVDAPLGQPVRYEIDMSRWCVVGRYSCAYDRSPDFPVTDAYAEGQFYESLWMLGISSAGKLGRKFFDQLVRTQWSYPEKCDCWSCPTGCYLGSEPAFIPNPNRHHGGIVICHVFDAGRNRSCFSLFDSHAIAGGPIARIQLTGAAHLGFHATFIPDQPMDCV